MKIKKLLRNITIVWILIFWTHLYAGKISVSTSLDKSVIHIGDYIKYSITIKYKSKLRIILQPPGANLGQFDIKDYNVVDLKKDKNGFLMKKIEYTITTYFLGEFEIPSVEINYIDDNGNKGYIKSESMVVKVIPIERRPGDKDDIRDIKKPIYVKNYTLLYILIALFILGLIAVVVYLFLKNRKREVSKEEIEKQREPEDIEAMKKIDELVSKQYIEQGMIKQFYFELSEIIREYLSRRYKIATLERTSYEIMTDLNKLLFDKELIKKFDYFFNESDMVKFAKHIPDKNQLKSIVPDAKELIERTKKRVSVQV